MTRPRDLSLRIAGIAGAALLGAYVILSIAIGEDFAIPVGIISAVSATIILRGQLGKALAARIEGQLPADGAPPEEVLVELDDLRHRVVELEERLDFTERLLTQSREGAGLPPFGGAGQGGT